MTRRGSPCEEAVTRLLEADAGATLPAAVTGHLAQCAECGLLARDLGVFRGLVAEARADVDARVPPPDVLAALAAGARTADAQRSLRLVQGGAAAPPARTTRRFVTPRRVIPIAVAVAASLVAVSAGWVLLHPKEPHPRATSQIVLHDTGERPESPRRASAPALPAISVTAPTLVPPSAPPEPGRGDRKDSTSQPRRAGSTLRTPSPATSEVPGPEIEAQQTLRRQLPRLQNCYERALRRDLRLGDATADITVDITPNGAIESVAVSGNASPELRRCLEQTVRNADFPVSDTGLRVSVPLRFEVVRERMGTNIAPGSRTQP